MQEQPCNDNVVHNTHHCVPLMSDSWTSCWVQQDLSVYCHLKDSKTVHDRLIIYREMQSFMKAYINGKYYSGVEICDILFSPSTIFFCFCDHQNFSEQIYYGMAK